MHDDSKVAILQIGHGQFADDDDEDFFELHMSQELLFPFPRSPFFSNLFFFSFFSLSLVDEKNRVCVFYY